jgi:hypothetical protein
VGPVIRIYIFRPHQINFLFVGPPARKKASSRKKKKIFLNLHLFRYLQNKIFNLLSAFMQWFLSVKTIVIEKIVHSNTMAEVFVASIVSPVKILLCNYGLRTDLTILYWEASILQHNPVFYVFTVKVFAVSTAYLYPRFLLGVVVWVLLIVEGCMVTCFCV